MRVRSSAALAVLLLGGRESAPVLVPTSPHTARSAAVPVAEERTSPPLPALRPLLVRWRELAPRPGLGLRLRVERDPALGHRVTALHEHRRTLYAGMLNEGLFRRRGGRWRVIELLDPRVSALASGPDGALWVGTAGGLARLDASDRAAPVRDPRGWFTRHINALARTRDVLWVFVHPGAVAVTFAEGRVAHYRYVGRHDGEESVDRAVAWSDDPAPLERAAVFARVEDPRGAWLATREGVVRVEGARAAALTEHGGALPGRFAVDVAWRGGSLWALLWREGLARWRNGALEVWRQRWIVGPRSLVPYRDGWLVATEDRGLLRLRVRGARVEAAAWGAAEGVPRGFVTAVAVAGGAVWLGGAFGVARVVGGGRALAMRGG